LIALENKVLAQQRTRHGGTNGGQIVEMALEGGFIGQDADASRSVLFVDAGDGDRIEIGAQ